MHTLSKNALCNKEIIKFGLSATIMFLCTLLLYFEKIKSSYLNDEHFCFLYILSIMLYSTINICYVQDIQDDISA